jgi:hypothetical protein
LLYGVPFALTNPNERSTLRDRWQAAHEEILDE